jgi:DNA-binding transcriptional MerR regulator
MPLPQKRRYGKFDYITVGYILNLLEQDGLKITRDTFRRLEKEGLFFSPRTVGGYRRYTEEETKIIVHLIKQNYGVTHEN